MYDNMGNKLHKIQIINPCVKESGNCYWAALKECELIGQIVAETQGNSQSKNNNIVFIGGEFKFLIE